MGTLRICRVSRFGGFLRLLALSAGLAAAAGAHAKVYVCVSATGEKQVRDTPCPVAPASSPAPVRLPPCPLTTDAVRRASRLEVQFLGRFPDEATHRSAQRAALQVVVTKLRRADIRLNELQPERKAIEAERQFHPDGRLPPPWQARANANEGSFAGLADTYRQLELEIAGVRSHFECERATFARMWSADAAPGSSACDRPACAPA